MTLQSFYNGYIECASWLIDEEEQARAKRFSQPAKRMAMRDCRTFYDAHYVTLNLLNEQCDSDDARHGHDFWLTRNGHGAGFWDRGYGAAGDALTTACDAYREISTYVGPRGAIYFEGV